MILTKTPLRISFVGGGSDRPWFYQEEPGACVAATINKYVYVAVKSEFTGRVLAHYRATEDVATVAELQHDRMRACLKSFDIQSGIEVASLADVPGSTGLGSSSSFTVGLLHAIDHHVAICPPDNTEELAHEACVIEIEDCRAPIGKQDQYTAAYGGVNLLGFTSKGVSIDPISCDMDALSFHCLLLDTGLTRQGDAGAVLAGQRQDRDDVRELAWLAQCFAKLLAEGELEACGETMHHAWQIKRRYVGSHQLDLWYAAARYAGAWGGKLCGAGGGGFLLFLAPPERHRAIIQALGLRHVPIRVGVEGCRVVYHS